MLHISQAVKVLHLNELSICDKLLELCNKATGLNSFYSLLSCEFSMQKSIVVVFSLIVLCLILKTV